MSKLLFTISLILIALSASAQITFQKTFGGANDDQGRSAQQTLDGGNIITGYTKSFNNGFQDVYLIKTDSSDNA